MTSFDARVERFGALSGLAAMFIGLGGMVVSLSWGQQGWVYAQPSLGSSAATIARFWAKNHTAAMVGTTGFELAWVVLIFWVVQLALMIWRLNDGLGHRLLTLSFSCAHMTIPFLMMVVTAFWTVAAYRAGHIASQITATMSDLGYLGSFVWGYTALVTMIGFGWLILRARNSPAAFPAWTGWLSVICGLGQLPALAVHFFHRGIWSLNGLLGWYEPLAGWFIWTLILSPIMFRMIKPPTAHRPEQHNVGARPRAVVSGGPTATY
jgi:hypothetical protein